MDRKAIKAKAKEFAFKNKWNIWKVFLVYILISGLLGGVAGFIMGFLGVDTEGLVFNLVTYLIQLAVIPMIIGYTAYLIKLVRGEQMTIKDALLSKYSIFVLILVANIVVSLCGTLWTLLLVVPGVIYAYKMAMVNYILADDLPENTTWKDVLDKSKEMMEGHKMDYFVFELSFFGWFLLSGLTFGIALIWVLPYVEIATVMYYEELKKIKA